jgi:16S rRNA (uracil1498-N3)-methyltransferase
MNEPNVSETCRNFRRSKLDRGRWSGIIHSMRRVHVPELQPGPLALDERQSHHLRHVLRLPDGEPVEVFDNAGRQAAAVLRYEPAGRVTLRIDAAIRAAVEGALQITIASAVPKGNRADWMIEKLGELGVSEFVPLVTVRSVVVPEGRNKLQRWERIATEAAKQSRREGVMRIASPMPLEQAVDLLQGIERRWHLSPSPEAAPAWEALRAAGEWPACALLIGPEGGWTDAEQAWLASAGVAPLRLGRTILRIETAAVAAAALLAAAGGVAGGS